MTIYRLACRKLKIKEQSKAKIHERYVRRKRPKDAGNL